MSSCKVYVADLSAYVSGRMVGEWVYVESSEQLSDEIERIADGHEWAIHDSEGFGSWRHGENPDLETLCKVAAALEEHEGSMRAALEIECDAERAVEMVEERYAGEYRSLEDWAESFLDDTGALKEVPDSLRYYIDFEKWARDAELSGDIVTASVDGMVHVFWNH